MTRKSPRSQPAGARRRMRKKSARRVQGERTRLAHHQDAVKEQAIRWIEGLDIIIEIEYSSLGGEQESMTVRGIPKK